MRSFGTSFHTARPGTSSTATTTMVNRPKLMRAGTVRTKDGSTTIVGWRSAIAVSRRPAVVSAIDGVVMPQPLEVTSVAARPVASPMKTSAAPATMTRLAKRSAVLSRSRRIAATTHRTAVANIRPSACCSRIQNSGKLARQLINSIFDFGRLAQLCRCKTK